MSLLIASMMRNEEGRFLRPLLSVWKEITNDIFVLDDGSTDATADILREADVEVLERAVAERAWGAEASARQTLFEEAWRRARIDDFILFLDADMIPAADPSIFMAPDVDSVSFVLYDMWSPTHYRTGGFWQAHHHGRVWMIRKRLGDMPSEWQWNERGIHTGHLPLNFPYGRVLFAPKTHGLLHYAYADEALRQDKYVQYASVAAQLTPTERAHARSILDDDPFLLPLPSVDFRLA